MSSRPPPGAEAVRELEEEMVSGGAEGDEIMEEPEEQEDGYSTCFSPTFPTRRSPFRRCSGQQAEELTQGCFTSLLDPHIDIDMDYLVLFPAWS